MDFQNLLENIRNLTDLELAVLLSLIMQQNCLVTTEEDLIDDLSSELALIASEVFKLSYAVVALEDSISVEKFGEAILDQNHNHDFGNLKQSAEDLLHPNSRLASVNIRAGSIAPSNTSQLNANLDSRTVANIVIAKNFNHASRDVQIAALELITRRRIYSRTTVHQVPKTFIFIPLVSTATSKVRLNDHLNDRISISHYHDPDHGFANLEDLETHIDSNEQPGSDDDEEKRSTYSYSASYRSDRLTSSREIRHSVIEKLREMGQATTITPEIRRYIQDITVFLRMARGVDGGISPFATTQLVSLAKHLAPLHGIDFVTPALVTLAARKVYPHRIVIASPTRERSMQWGSDLDTVKEYLGTLTAEAIMEQVLFTVPSPL